jgi:hypothetical protein
MRGEVPKNRSRLPSFSRSERLEGHCQRLVVLSPDDTEIAHARPKPDKLDSRMLASLPWKGELEVDSG